jgi:quinol monooxygenase YgiN
MARADGGPGASTLEPKDGRRDELVQLLAELAKHIRGEPGYLQYSVHRPLGEDKGPLLVIQRYTSLEATKNTARGRAARRPGSASSSQRPRPLPSCSNRSRSGTTRRSNSGSVPQRLSYSLRDEEGTDRGPLIGALSCRKPVSPPTW